MPDWENLNNVYTPPSHFFPSGQHQRRNRDNQYHERDGPQRQVRPRGLRLAEFIADATVTLPYQIDFENAPRRPPPLSRSSSPISSTRTWTGKPSSSPSRLGRYNHHDPGRHPALPDDRADDLQRPDIRRGHRSSASTPTPAWSTPASSRSTRTPSLPPQRADRLPAARGRHRPRRGLLHLHGPPKAGLPTGTQIRNVALVSFDAAAADRHRSGRPTKIRRKGIDPTKEASDTIDAGPPTSSVQPCPPPKPRRASR